ncbi:MAG TPA: nitroreductase family protein [Candidatus Competibacteraceae bacterium]|nr:MAG: nitroreductase [Candidatus Competibacteraceae bacterium]HOB60589.1 nitroreductase family protein [Candidatus Competibacteraceae bacterium]HQD54960.1 nitroreductase family protein [Candidatus Competibacteraceae bacterium]
MFEKPAVTQVAIADLIARRWSPRAIDPTQPVGRDQLIALLEAARWAPSCFGDQPWRFLVWDRSSDPAGWQRAFECLAEGNQIWVQNAPVLILSVAVPHFGHNGQPNRWAQYDTGAATENLCLQATALGLAAHQMGGFDSEQAKARFNIPADHTCMAMVAIGHPGSIDALPDALSKKEQALRERKSLGQIAFAGGWGQSFR